MLPYTQRPERRKKATLLNHVGIGMDTLLCREAMPANLSTDQLCANEVYEMDLITRGSGICQIMGQSIPCKQGDAFVIPPDILHNCYAAEPGEEIQISRLFFDPHDWFRDETADVESQQFCHGVFRDGSLIAYATLNAQVYDRVTAIWQAISHEIALAEPDWKEMVRAYLSVLFITLGRYIGEAEHTTDATAKELHYAGMAVRMVMESLGNSELKLETIADAMHISKSHFSRLFKAFTGETFSAYLRNVRLNHACRLLRETDQTVESIVTQCGLKDMPSFYRNFQAVTGLTPNQYRLQARKQALEKEQRLLLDISETLQRGDGKTVSKQVQQALEEGCDPQRILNEGMLAGMSAVGEKFKNNQVFVPEVLVAVRAMNLGIQTLKPYLVSMNIRPKGRVCIGTVQGDLHDIGKNLVKLMLESKGLEVIDLGTDVPARRFVEVAREQKCQVIGCSALLTTTRDVMADVIKEAERADIRNTVRIMVGGAPVNEDFCRAIGADCYTPDAVTAAEAALAFCNQSE